MKIFLKLLIFELKKYMSPRVVCPVLLFAGLTAAVYLITSMGVLGEAIVSPFQIAVVDKDNSSEIDMLINIFNEQGKINGIVSLAKMDETSAISNMEKGQVAAYILVPEGFTESVKNGQNIPLKLSGFLDSPLKYAMSVILLEAGVSFLSASQSGIYATIDYAFENGISFDEINRNIVYPVNLKFLSQLMGYDKFFKERVVSATGNFSPEQYYIISFSIFFIVINIMAVINLLTINKGTYVLYKMAGLSLFKQILLKFFGGFIINILLTLPLSYFFGIKFLLIPMAISAFSVLCAVLFDEAGAGLFIFMAGFFMLFVSGGIIPLVYLPEIFDLLKLFSVNYWVLSLNDGVLPSFVFIGATVLFFAASYLRTCLLLPRQ